MDKQTIEKASSDSSSCCHSEKNKLETGNLATTNYRFWQDTDKWLKSAHNTKWCLIGCSIGDFGTILFFQLTQIAWPTAVIMTLAIINGLLTSIMLETWILIKQSFRFKEALKVALGMSFISMLAMEFSMNLIDWFLTGGARLNWWVVPIMLLAGFLTPWPYNYWRLKKFNKSCH